MTVYEAPQVEDQYELTKRVVNSVAARWKNPALDMEDLYQEAMLALVKSVHHWPTSNPWRPWATAVITHATIDALRKNDPLSRAERKTLTRYEHATYDLASAYGRVPSQKEILEESGVTKEEYAAAKKKEHLTTPGYVASQDSEGDTVEHPIEKVVDKSTLPDEAAEGKLLWEMLAELIRENFDDRDAKIIVEIFVYDQTAAYCCDKYDLSKARVSQIVNRFKTLAKEKILDNAGE